MFPRHPRHPKHRKPCGEPLVSLVSDVSLVLGMGVPITELNNSRKSQWAK
jgi:hypothetical protein